MHENYVNIVYDLLIGARIHQADDPLVENLFADGQECELLYSQVYDANLRLCQRLGVEEDSDVETIVSSLLKICELAAKRMYRYGAEFQDKM